MQASLQSEMVKAGSNGGQTGFISLCREILSRFISDRFPTVVEGIVSDDVYSALDLCLFIYTVSLQ